MFFNCMLILTLMTLTMGVKFHANMSLAQLGWEPVAVNETSVVYVANEATDYVKSQLNSTSAYKLESITKAKRQIFPDGGIFKMTLELGLTICLAQEDVALKTCLVLGSRRCKVIALMEGKSTEVLSYWCKPLPTIGAPWPIDRTNRRLQEAAKFAVLQQFKGSHTMHEIVNAYVQVVSGILYFIRIEIEKIGASQVTRCTTIVGDQPWRTPRLETGYFQCDKEAA